MNVQVNTMVTAQTVGDVPAIYEVVRDLGIARWALFFLIATGRGAALDSVTAEESERFLNWLWRLAGARIRSDRRSNGSRRPMRVRTTRICEWRAGV